jgi:PAS domain S-box-containing protein
LIDQGILIIDQRGRIRDANKSFLAMVSLVRTSVVSRHVEDFLHDNEIFQKTLKACDVDQPEQAELRWRCQKSPYCNSNITITKITDTQFLVMIRPIIEDEEDELEVQYQTLLNQAQVGIMIWQVNPARISYANPRICQLLGYTEEELLSFRGEEAFCVLHPEDRATVASRFMERLEGASVQRVYETRGLRKDGEAIWLQVAASFITYRGEPASLTTILDVTDQVQARVELQISEEKYRSLVENIQDGVFVIQNEKMAYVNDALAEMLGTTRKEMEGTKFQDHIAPEDLKLVEERYFRLQRGEDIPPEYEFRLLHKDGRRVIANLNIGTTTYMGGIASIGTLKNITIRKEAEAKRQAAAEAAMLYLDIMGHDIRNQLQGILIGAEILAAKDQSSTAVDAIVESTKACQKLISDIHATEDLLFSSLEETNLVPALETEITRTKEIYRDIIVDTNLAERPARIIADTHLNYLLQVLLENAVRHNPNDTKRIWISLDSTNSEYRLEIADNGSGLDDFRKANLFNKSRRFGGVGLHQARAIMDKYTGTISVEDRVDDNHGEGAKFILTFPKM